ALCNRSTDRFNGTPYRINLAQELDLAVKRAEQELTLAQQKGYGTVVPSPVPDRTPSNPTPPPTAKPTPTPTPTPKPTAKPVTPAPAPVRPAPPAISAKALISRFTEAANSGKIHEISRDNKRVPVTGADADGIKTDQGVLPWSSVTLNQLASALVESGTDRDLLDIAGFLRQQGEVSTAEKALFKYAKADKARQPEIDEIVAAWRGLGSAPEGGYAWNARIERYEDKVERASSLAVEKCDDMIKSLARATTDAKVEQTFAKIEKTYTAPDVNSAAREEIRHAAIEALKEAKAKLVEEVKKKAKRPAGDLSSAARKLDEVRKECLRVMYDTNIYYVEGHAKYDEGLRKYLASCEPLHNVWNGKWQSSIDASLKSTIDTVNKINDILSKKLASSEGNELTGADLEEFVANAAAQGQALTIKNYALTSAQRDAYNYNDRVERYNNGTYKSSKLSSTGAGPETIEHLKFLNAWREELGRRKLFMDDRLQRAATKHARDQAAAGKIWHVGSNGSPSSRVKAEGFPGGCGENCCLGYGSAMAAFKAWDEASDHCRNQCSDNWNCIGVGHSGSVWVQDLGRTTPPGEVGGN
ncbi:MAG TPA: CAP domain-containing protein, partial [Planctomycetota bacterium]|nr:CAP domain-containing protein [Planctomycetota bacterium]